MAERAGIDLSPAGILEAEIGKFIQRRVEMRNSAGKACTSIVVQAGEDPSDHTAALVTLDFDCRSVDGQIFYDPSSLLDLHGNGARQSLTLVEESRVGAVELSGTNRRANISVPLPELIYEETDPKDLELGPRRFVGKPLKLRDMQCLYADLNEYRCWSSQANMTVFAQRIQAHSGSAEFDTLCGKSKNANSRRCKRTILGRELING